MAGRSRLEVDLSDYDESRNIMVHAYPGQGKTRFAVGAPNPVLLSSEPGALSAKRAGAQGGLVRVTNWSVAVEFLRAVEAGEFSHRDWAIVDTITTLQQKNQNAVMDRAVAENPAKFDPDVPAVQHYLKQQNSLSRWVERVIDAPINTIWLAHTMDVEDKDGGRMLMPSITGGQDKGWKVASYIMSLMNAVGYMEMRTVVDRDADGKKTGERQVRRILWQPYTNPDKDIRYVAKDHFNAFGFYTDDLDFKGHLALIDEEPAEEKPVTTARPRKRAA